MGGSIDRQIEAAERRGKRKLESDPRAVSARYDRASSRVFVELVDGCAYLFPAHHVEDLKGALPEDLEKIEVDGVGYNLHWPTLDVDLYVPALVAGLFGTRAWMASAFARAGGQAKTPAKSAAARANGAKGGRPRKTARQ